MSRFENADDADVAIDTVPPVKAPWVTRAQEARLPYKVHASLHTDARTSVVRETRDAILRRTLPRGA